MEKHSKHLILVLVIFGAAAVFVISYDILSPAGMLARMGLSRATMLTTTTRATTQPAAQVTAVNTPYGECTSSEVGQWRCFFLDAAHGGPAHWVQECSSSLAWTSMFECKSGCQDGACITTTTTASTTTTIKTARTTAATARTTATINTLTTVPSLGSTYCNGRSTSSNRASINPSDSWNTVSASLGPSDTNRYKVTADKQGFYVFTFCSGGGEASFDTVLCLLDSSGKQIGYNDDTCGSQSSLIQSLGPGTYYIQVSGYSSESGEYTLVYTVY
jgi:hypothetical protein